MTTEHAQLERAEARVAELEAELAAVRSEAQHRQGQLAAWVNRLPLGLLLIDEQGRVQFTNQTYRDLLKLDEQDLAADTLLDLTNSKRAAAVFQNPDEFLRRCLEVRTAGRDVLNEEVPLRDGRLLERDYVVLTEGRAGRLVCFRDVTQKRRQEADLRTMSLISEQNPNPIIRLTASGEQVYANEAARQLQHQLSGEALPALHEELASLAGATLRTGQQQRREAAVGELHYLLHAVPVPGEACATLYLTDITDRCRAEQQLSQQREFYESILENVPVGIIAFNERHEYRYVNPHIEPDPVVRQWLIGKHNFDSCLHRNRPIKLALKRQAMFEQALRERREVTWEEELAYPGQGTRHFLRCKRPVYGPDGRLRMVVSSGIDITERQRAEALHRQSEALVREQQAFIRQIVDTIPSVLIVSGEQGISFSNAAFEDVKNRRTKLCIKQQTSSLQQREVQRMIEWDEQVVQTGQALCTEAEFTMDDGAVAYYQVDKRPLVRADGSVEVLTINTDITELRRTREDLARQAKQYRDLMEYTQALICTHDLQGRILSANPALAAMFGVPMESLIGLSLLDYLPPHRQQELREYLAACTQQQQATGVMEVREPGGRVRYVLYQNRVVTEPHAPTYVIAYAQEITDRILAERELRRAKKEAEAAAQARESFLANMSHEIRTPLNGVLGMAKMLDRTELNEQQHEYLNIIRDSGQHLLGVLNDVLDIAKISSGNLELEHTPCLLPELVGKAGRTLSYRAAEKGICFETELTGLPAGPVLSDPYRLSQVLLNLLSNAIKFTEQGQVRLVTRVLAETTDRAVVSFRVSDTGPGVPIDKQESIFQSFAQAHADTTRRYGGTGLGLSISSQLVEQLGGHLVMGSDTGQGCTFAFTLSFAKAAPVAVVAPPPAAAPALEQVRGWRVLLVEDHEVNRQLAQLMLEYHGVIVDGAENGVVALERFRQARYDVVLMDIQMPEMNGLEATALMRSDPDPQRARTPIIALTANAFRADNERYLAAGMNDCLAKPFEEQELLRRMVAVRQAQPQAPAAPLFDLTDMLKMMHGSRAAVARILTTLLSETAEVLTRLQQAAAAADWALVTKMAHRLKPGFKLLRVADLTSALEALEAGQLPEAQRYELVNGLEPAVAELLAELRQWVQANAAS